MEGLCFLLSCVVMMDICQRSKHICKCVVTLFMIYIIHKQANVQLFVYIFNGEEV